LHLNALPKGMIEYEEEWFIKLIFRCDGSVGWRAALFAVPAGAFAVLLLVLNDQVDNFWQESGINSITGSQTWVAATAVLTILLGFRTRQALSRFWEGTGLLHQMRGEWFDSVSCCVTFSRAAQASKPQEVADFRHTLVRLMSLCHASALEEIAGEETEYIPRIDMEGLDKTTLAHLKDCKVNLKFNRVEVILHLIQTLITKNLDCGILKIPPPILSRVYQTLSRGFVNLLNAKKITDTRFPFPYAQLISMLLFLHMVLTPTMMVQLIEHKAWAAIFTMVPIFGMFSLNLVASELENPFGNDANDLPMAGFQRDMNSSLLMLLHCNTDHVAGTSEDCLTDFEELAASMASDIHRVGTSSSLIPDSHASPPSTPGRRSPSQQESPRSGTSVFSPDGPANAAASAGQSRQGEAEAAQPSSLARAAEPEPVPAPAPVPLPVEEPQVNLVKGMDDFNAALLSWTKVVDAQIGELNNNFAALKRISDSVPEMLASIQAGNSQWKTQFREETTLMSLQAFPAL